MAVTAEETQGAGASLDRTRLLKDLQAQARLLEDDLRERTDSEPEFRDALRVEYEKAVAAERTAAMYETWRDERVVQIAAAWVLACVFVRFSEDNGLIPDAWLSGPGDRLAEAQDRHDAYFRENPSRNDRDWLLDSFDALAKSHRTVEGLFDRAHNPLYEVTPSYEAATALLAFWRQRGADGEIVHDFTDPELSTRFLGDLYQDLSEHARKTYALLQTPVFVEEFILDLTLEPAVEEFGLTPAWKHRPAGWDGEVWADGPGGEEVVRGLRCIDPACGSGHFLLGMFERLLGKWREAEPGTEPWVLVRRALESVHGADKNPFAVAIARFRLLVAALKAGGVRELSAAPGLPIRVAVADSLLHGRDRESETDTFDALFAESETFYYRTEDVEGYAREVDLLGRGSYHVVVANPPYITVKDSQENQNYRNTYFTCAGKYALSVPFAQRIFELAIRAEGDQQDGGFTGQITSNSFMKREFGKVLIEAYFHGGRLYRDSSTGRKRDFAGVDLTHVIDTSGAFIPGHGTPTVILAGRNHQTRQTKPIRAVLGVRGEPSQPENAAEGIVWTAIVEQVTRPGSESEWVSVEDAKRERFADHPWSLSGGGAGTTKERIETAAAGTLGGLARSIGITSVTGEDDLYLLPRNGAAHRLQIAATHPLVTGDIIRDFSLEAEFDSIWVYDGEYRTLPFSSVGSTRQLLTDFRTAISSRKRFGVPMLERGMAWHEWQELYPSKLRSPLSIAYGEVATHNHFVLDRGGKAFKQTAPVIKLPDDSSEEQHLELLGLLNSSTSCFWMKQVSQGKGNRGGERSTGRWAWEEHYQFASTKLQKYPLPSQLPLPLGRKLDTLAQASAQHAPSTVTRSTTPTRDGLDEARRTQEQIRARMIALQEELDWTVYGAYGLLTAEEVARTTIDDVPEVALGQRAFEIVLARKVAAGAADTAWFERHGSTPTTEIPAHWPESYRAVVQARIDLIEANKDIRLIERPEYKRRWSIEPWEKREAAAIRNWLLDAAEREDLWFDDQGEFTAPRTLTVNQLADALRHDKDVQAVAELYAADHLGKRDASLATVLAAVIDAEHVPYLAALRYKDSGLRKRAQWEQVWEQQREEDRTGQQLDIKVPPKYTGADFLKHSYWSNRGKLDVPKERFISYPGASPDSDGSLLLGWAGWNHRDQADALVGMIRDRVENGGWAKEDPRFVPLLAGLREVLPWVHQWYGEYDEEWEGNPAEEFQSALETGRTERQLSESDLVNWRPEKKPGGRKKKSE
ncbi:BREX-2 system adenine-specific DNA-methyltransferase PglX [Streptomyces sp. NPDC001450]